MLLLPVNCLGSSPSSRVADSTPFSAAHVAQQGPLWVIHVDSGMFAIGPVCPQLLL
jgi:hypothetical protein